MNPFVAAGIIVALGLMAYLLTKNSGTPPVETPTGGTTLAGSPSTAPATSGTVAAVSTASPSTTPSTTPASAPSTQPSAPLSSTGQRMTAKILIIKDTSALTSDTGNNGADWRTFAVAEVFAYAGDRKLAASDYSDASLSSMYGNNLYPAALAIDGNPKTFSHTGNDPIGIMTLTLKDPTVITKVEVLNRQDCCQGRLAGATLVLKDSVDATIWSGVLTAAGDQVYSM